MCNASAEPTFVIFRGSVDVVVADVLAGGGVLPVAGALTPVDAYTGRAADKSSLYPFESDRLDEGNVFGEQAMILSRRLQSR